MAATNTNTASNAESERFVERGEENGIPFVFTEKGYYPNIVKIKYIGDKIPDIFKEKEELVNTSVKEKPTENSFLDQFDFDKKTSVGFTREL